ncbi:MAG TPA: hypothetical protein VF989_16445 [Polyangiaceae bacterium]
MPRARPYSSRHDTFHAGHRSACARAVASLAVPIAASGCFPPGDGIEPPENGIYFPTGLALDAQARHLFVVNSDFDLQFNAGVLQSWDLERLREAVPAVCSSDADCPSGLACDTEPSEQNGAVPSFFCVERSGSNAGRPCRGRGERTAAEAFIAPGRCAPIRPERPVGDSGPIIAGAVQIGAFATDVAFRAQPDDRALPDVSGRLFIPVRGDATLHFIDVSDDGALACGQTNNGGACDDRHRAGDEPEEDNTRGLRLPPEPYGVAASGDGRAVVITHQTEGAVSLFVHRWNEPPMLEFVQGGLPSRPIGLAAIPTPAAFADTSYAPGFLATFRNDASVFLLRFFEDGALSGDGAQPARPFLAAVDSASVATNSSGSDSRGLAVDDSARRRAERSCAEGDAARQSECEASPACTEPGAADECAEQCVAAASQDCLVAAASVPLDVFVANRTPPSLLIGRTSSSGLGSTADDVPTFYDSVPLSAGPSRVVVGDVTSVSGVREPRVFVSCFDSRSVYVYDPARRRVETIIESGRGPFALAVDSAHALLYVGHFTDSYVGVASLDQRVFPVYGKYIATIGVPTPPRASK